MTTIQPAYIPGLVKLVGKTLVNEEFSQITIAGDCLANLAEHGLDQRIKVIIPRQQPPVSTQLIEDPQNWYTNWRNLSEAEREPIRTYTILNPSNQSCSLDLLIANHEPEGVVGRWLADASIGDQLVVVFPNRLSLDSGIGIDWQPGRATDYLILADVTAIPAVKGILTGLGEVGDSGTTGAIVIESAVPIDALDLPTAGLDVVWLKTSSADLPGTKLTAWVAQHLATTVLGFEVASEEELVWDSPSAGDRDRYLWCAAEAGAVKTIRRLVKDSGAYSKNDCAFMGYWKRGFAG